MSNPYSFYTAEERGSGGRTPGSWLDRGRAGLAPPALPRPLLLAADRADAGVRKRGLSPAHLGSFTM